MTTNQILLVAAIGLGAYWLYRNKSGTASIAAPNRRRIESEFRPRIRDDARYMEEDPEYSQVDYSTGDGETLFSTLKLTANYPTFTGGTFLRPQFLPPVRTTTIQARLV